MAERLCSTVPLTKAGVGSVEMLILGPILTRLGGREYKSLTYKFFILSFRFATGTIARSYTAGQVIDITLDLVANHLVKSN